MIDIEPFEPGYVIHISTRDEWNQVVAYIREKIRRSAAMTYTCDGISISFKNGIPIRYGKCKMDWYYQSEKHRDYKFIEFSDLVNVPADICDIFSAMSDLL